MADNENWGPGYQAVTEDDFKAQQFRVQNLWNPEELLKGPRLRRNVTKVNAAGEIVPDDRTRTRRAEEVEDNTPGRHEGSEIAVHPSEMPMGIARHRRTINDVEELLVRDWNDREEGDDAAGTIREKGKDRETVLNRPIMTSSEDGIGGESQSIGDTILRNTIPTIPAPQMPPNLHSSHPSNHPAGDTTLENTPFSASKKRKYEDLVAVSRPQKRLSATMRALVFLKAETMKRKEGEMRRRGAISGPSGPPNVGGNAGKRARRG